MRLRRKSVTRAVVLGVIFRGRLSSLTVLGVSIFSSAAAAVLNPKRPFGIKGGPVGPGPKTLGLGTRPWRVRGRSAAGRGRFAAGLRQVFDLGWKRECVKTLVF